MKFIDLFFPPVCPICNGRTGKNVLCDKCDIRMKELEVRSEKYVSVDGKSVKAYYVYDYGSKEFERYVFALKKQGNKDLFLHAAGLLSVIIPDEIVSKDAVVTGIPRRKLNVRLYGYDQSGKIAKSLAKISGMRYEVLLKRKGFSKEQKDLDAKQRQSNVSGKFRAVYKRNVSEIVVIDDVLTTGSSFSECVRALRSLYGNDVEIAGVFLAAKNRSRFDYI